MVLGSNREAGGARCHARALRSGRFRVVAAMPALLPVIDTLTAEVEAGETQLTLRLLPPAGQRRPDRVLMACWPRLRQQARDAGKKEAGASGAVFSWCAMPLPPLGRPPCSRCIAARAAPSARCLSPAMCFGPAMTVLRRQLVYVAVSRASQAVWLVAEPGRPAAPPIGSSGADGLAQSADAQRQLQPLDALPAQVDRQHEAHQRPPADRPWRTASCLPFSSRGSTRSRPTSSSASRGASSRLALTRLNNAV